MSIHHFPLSGPSVLPDSLAGRICAGVHEFSNEHGSKGQDRLKGMLDGLALAAIKQSPAVAQPHERRAVLHAFNAAYRQFYTLAGLQQLIKNKRLRAYAELQAVYATASAAEDLEHHAGGGGAIR